MRLRRRLLAALLTAVMVVGGAAVAWAGFPDVAGTRWEEGANYLRGLGVVAGDPDGRFYPERSITRAEAAKIIIMITGRGAEALGLAGQAAFPDTATHWGSGYIACAKLHGIVGGFPDGTFRPQELVTYAQFAKMVVEAAGLDPAPGLGWPDNYMTVAQAQGVFTGIPSHLADRPAVRGDCAMMAAYTVRFVENPETGLTLAQSVFPTAVGSVVFVPDEVGAPVGGGVQLTATAFNSLGSPADAVLSYSTTSPAAVVTATGIFVGTATGRYTVLAAAPNGITGTCVVEVYGPAKKLAATASESQVPANGASKVTVEVTVCDQGGNRVANDSLTMVALSHQINNGAVTLGPTPKQVSSGVASFELTATENAGREDTLRFADVGGVLTAATVEVATVDQVATSILVEPDDALLKVNEAVSTMVTATVRDQVGEKMAEDAWSLLFSISGQGTFDGDSTAPQTIVTAAQQAAVRVWSSQAEPGRMTVQVSSAGLTAGSASITTYLAGEAEGISASVPDSSITACDPGPGGNRAEFAVALVDAHGNPTDRDTALNLDVTLGNGGNLFDAGLGLQGAPVILAGESESEALFIGSLNLNSGQAGTHLIKVTPDDPDLDPVTFQVQVGPGPVGRILSSLPVGNDVRLPIVNPQLDVTVQLYDAADNPVRQAGVDVAVGWDDPLLGNTGKPTINGVYNPAQDESSPAALKAKTDAEGRAHFDFLAGGYVNDDYELDFKAGILTATTGRMTVSDRVVGFLNLRFEDEGAHQVTQMAANLDQVAFLVVEVQDTNHLPLDGELIEIAFSGEGRNLGGVTCTLGTVIVPYFGGRIVVKSDDGQIILALAPGLAGTFTATAASQSVAPPVSEEKSFKIVVGNVVARVSVTTPSGGETDSLDVLGDVPVQLKLHPTDFGGNPIAAPGNVTVKVSQTEGLFWHNSTPGDGQFRLSTGGTGIPEGDLITIPRGQSSLSIWYVQPEDEDGVGVGIRPTSEAYCAYQIDHTSAYFPGPPQGFRVTCPVLDGSGNPMPGVTLTAWVPHGTVTPSTDRTGADGKLIFTWTGGHNLDKMIVTVLNALRGDGSPVETQFKWVIL